MQIYPSQKTSVFSVSAKNPSVIDEEQLATYWGVIGWPVAMTVFLIVWALLRSSDFLGWHEWVLKITMLCVVNVMAFRRYHQIAPMLVVSSLAGLTTGLLLAVFRLVAHYSFYLVFNLIAEPALTLGVALGVAGFLGMLFSHPPHIVNLFHRRIPKYMKG